MNPSHGPQVSFQERPTPAGADGISGDGSLTGAGMCLGGIPKKNATNKGWLVVCHMNFICPFSWELIS